MSTQFYNTTKEDGNELVESTENAIKQTDAILDFFKQNPDKEFTAEYINKIVLPKAFRTSIRRALTNLEEDGLIIFVGQTRSDDTNKKIREYRLNPAPEIISAPRTSAIELLTKCRDLLKNSINTQKLDLFAHSEYESTINEISKFLNKKRYKK